MITTLGLALLTCTHGQDDLFLLAPSTTIAWVQTDAHTPVLEQGLDHPLAKEIIEHPLVRAEYERSGFDPEAALHFAEAFLGTPPLELAHSLTAGGIGLGLLSIPGAKPRPFAVLRGTGASAVEDALETIYDVLDRFGAVEELGADALAKLGDRVSNGWRATDGQAFAARLDGAEGANVVLATTFDDLATCIQSKAPPAPLASPGACDAFGWVDVAAFDAMGQTRDLRNMVTDPGAHFALGPVLTHFGAATSIAFTAAFTADEIEMRAIASGANIGAGKATFPDKEQKSRPLLAPSESESARAVLWRDLATLMSDRTDLFDPKTLPGLAEGLGNLALLTDGPDGADELLEGIDPRILIVAEEVEFDEAAVPDLKFPATCLVIDLDDGETNGNRLVGAFQKLVTLASVDRAMRGEPGFVLGIRAVGDVAITTATLPPPSDSNSVDVAYNFVPACAVVGDSFIMGTHDHLVERLVERVANGQLERPEPGTLDRVTIHSAPLQELAAENREVLLLGAMLRDGKSRERAAGEIDTLLSLLERVDCFTFETLTPKNPKRHLEARLTVSLIR